MTIKHNDFNHYNIASVEIIELDEDLAIKSNKKNDQFALTKLSSNLKNSSNDKKTMRKLKMMN